MFKLHATAVPVVAADTRAAVTAADRALRANAQMLVSLVDGAEGSELPIHVTQDVYAALVGSNDDILRGREKLRRSITLLTAIHNRSDQREMATGCPGGLPEEGATLHPQLARS